MSRVDSSRLENGYYYGRLMHAIRKTIIKKSRKPFTLDPVIANLKDLTTKAVKESNWNILATELKKFGIKINKE